MFIAAHLSMDLELYVGEHSPNVDGLLALLADERSRQTMPRLFPFPVYSVIAAEQAQGCSEATT